MDPRSPWHVLHGRKFWLSAYRWNIFNFSARLVWQALLDSQRDSKPWDDQASWRMCSSTIILAIARDQKNLSRGPQSETFWSYRFKGLGICEPFTMFSVSRTNQSCRYARTCCWRYSWFLEIGEARIQDRSIKSLRLPAWHRTHSHDKPREKFGQVVQGSGTSR